MDRNRIEYIASLPHGDSVIAAALNDAEPLTVQLLADRFGVKDMLEAVSYTHLSKVVRFNEISLCRSEVPAMANTSPPMYSWRSGWRFSHSR